MNDRVTMCFHLCSTHILANFIRRDGRIVIADGSFAVTRDASGKPQYLLSMTKDITDRKQAEAALLAAKEEALAATRAKAEFLAKTAESEMKSVRELQQVLIPEAIPEVPGYAIASAYHPAQEVGGDFFQIIPLDDAATLIILGDVSGKGLKAAMNVAVIIGAVRTLAEFDSGPASILAGLNRRLVGRMQGGFTTALILKLDRFGHCILSNAGHLSPFLNGSEIAVGGSLPLGIVAEAEFVDQDFVLRDGDFLTVFTDGIPEARDKEGELYGFERMAALLSGRPSAESVARAASNFGQEDDITVLKIERLPASQAPSSVTVNLSASLARA